MSNRFHNKWHRHNHHTLSTPNEPDSAKDPIASEDDPFRGDFYQVSGKLVSPEIDADKLTLDYTISAWGDLSINIADFDNRFVNLSGDVMTGDLFAPNLVAGFYAPEDGITMSQITPEEHFGIDTTTGEITSYNPGADIVTHLVIPYKINGTVVTGIRDSTITTGVFSDPNLVSVVAPISLTRIGNRAFQDCSNLSSVSFPNVTTIGSIAFYICSNLSSVSFPNATTIGYSAFWACTNLSSASFPNATTIGSDAFWFCSNLSSVSFPNATTIGDAAFSNCSNYLSSVSFPNATTIGSFAFQECTMLESVHLGKTVPSTGTNIYLDTPNVITYAEYSDSWTAEGDTWQDRPLELLPNVTDGMWVSGNLTVSDSISSPNISASNLTLDYSISAWNEISVDLNELDGRYVNLSGDVMTGDLFAPNLVAGFYAPEDGITMSQITPEEYFGIDTTTGEITSYDPGADIIEHLVIPYKINGTVVTGIRDGDINTGVFYQDTNLVSVVAPISLTTIGGWVFQSCTSLESVSFPGVTSIKQRAFRECTNLSSVSFPNAITIGTVTFSECTSLSSISFPNVTAIGHSAFGLCSSLSSVSFPNVTTIVGSAFGLCTSLSSVSFPNAITIGSSAFRECTSLSSVSFPNVITIGSSVFRDCTMLESVHLGKTVPSTGTNIYLDTPNVTTYAEYSDSWVAEGNEWQDRPLELLPNVTDGMWVSGNLTVSDSISSPNISASNLTLDYTISAWNEISVDLNELDGRYVNLSGDTMTGPLSSPEISADWLTLDYSISAWDQVKGDPISATTDVYIITADNGIILVDPENGPVQAFTTGPGLTLSSVPTPDDTKYHVVTLQIDNSGDHTINLDENSLLFGESVQPHIDLLRSDYTNTYMLEYRWSENKPILHIIDSVRPD